MGKRPTSFGIGKGRSPLASERLLPVNLSVEDQGIGGNGTGAGSTDGMKRLFTRLADPWILMAGRKVQRPRPSACSCGGVG